ncbi:unnamed protein product [Mesocestoides corti]|uniref:non-specific serine/threonine protein kinase n=1 Tax=Mesocestoides corti TaxID=53468 RepID=A0A0R3U1U1_MESCO|nr:unnamed protein product [Mesocestoides corti]
MRTIKERCEELLHLYLNNYSDESGSFNIEFLLDTLTFKPLVEKIESFRLSRSEFETIRLIGSGAFGEVSLVRSKSTNEFYALKSLHKYDMLKRSDRACFQEEREVLVKGMIKGSPWITQLHYTFQDEKYLVIHICVHFQYFVMKFYNGGDMLTMLSKFDDQIPEHISRFYLAELVLAIHSLHDLGYVHRDIKPDNVLLETSGHIVLTDFGSCLRIGNDGLIKNAAAIGTPDYIAPEILRAAEDSHGTFGVECDYWSLGVVMYEMLFGETPFYSENLIQTYSQIMNFEKTFKIPEDEGHVSDAAKDLLKRFICDRKQRYGRNGIEEIVNHPFFNGIDWENIRSQPAPYQPEVKSPEDTSNFDIEETTRTHEGPPLGSVFRGCQVACIGFTFTKDSPLNQIGRLEEALGSRKTAVAMEQADDVASQTPVQNCTKCGELKSRVQDLETELAALSVKVQQPPASPMVNGASETEEKLAASEARYEELLSEVKKLHIALGALEARSINDEQKIAMLTQAYVLLGGSTVPLARVLCHRKSLSPCRYFLEPASLAREERSDLPGFCASFVTEERKTLCYLFYSLQAEQEKTENLRFDLREYEEENEDLCKRIQDTSSMLRDKESACEQLLNDLEEKRAELAAQRKTLDEYIQQSQNTNLPPHRQVVDGENNLSNGVSAGDSIHLIPELKLKLREAVTWAEECEAKLSNQENYWSDQQLRWQRERSELQDRVHEIVIERTGFLEGELRQERQLRTSLEQRVMLWENQLVELIQMADTEWAANDNLYETVLRLTSDLQRIRNGPSEIDYDPPRPSSAVSQGQGEDRASGNLNGLSSMDWRQRKAGKISKMERSNLQLALNNEIRERELAQQRARDLEAQLEEVSARLADTSNRLLHTEKEKENLREQLLKVTTEVRRSRMKTAEIDESACIRAELMNEKHKLLQPVLSPNDQTLQISKSEKSVSMGGLSSSGSGASSGGHKLVPDTFAVPTKCFVCSSLLLGQLWQGLRCQQCAFCCHLQCRQGTTTVSCPAAPSDVHSFDPGVACGLGTVLEGPVKTPKGDIKRGWIQQYAFLSDMRLFIYDSRLPSFLSTVACENAILEADAGHLPEGFASLLYGMILMLCFIQCTAVRRAKTIHPDVDSRDPRSATLGPAIENPVCSVSARPSLGALSVTLPHGGPMQITYETAYDIQSSTPAYIVDLNSSGFAVSRVSNADVIHAKRTEVPQILKVSPDDYAGNSPIYLLFDTSEECDRWHAALEDTVHLLSRNFARTPDTQCLQLHVLSDASFPLIKHILSACVLDENRILVGTGDGLYTVDLRYKTYARVGEKKPIYQVEALPEELQLVAVIQDKQRRLRLVLSGAIEGMNYDKIRVAEPKQGVSLLCHGWSRGRTTYLLCAAGATSIWVYEVVGEVTRHRRVVELTSPSLVQAINLVRDGDWLAVGNESSFVIYNIWSKGSMTVLLEPSCIDLDSSLLMFRHHQFEAQMAIPLNFEEFLLVFDNCAIYIDSQGQPTRPTHLFWPAKPLSRGFAYRQPFLHVFTESGLFLFNVETSTWSASAAGTRRLLPLSTSDGYLCLMTHGSSQAVPKLSSSVGGGGGVGGIGGAAGSFSHQGATATLVYLPPPRQSMFASLQRRRNASLLTSPLTRPLSHLTSSDPDRQLDLGNVSLLDATTRVRKSRRFSFFSRGSLFPTMELLDQSSNACSGNGISSSSTSGGPSLPFSKSRSSNVNGSRLISAPSDFQHVAHQGPDVMINLIDLAQSHLQHQVARCSTGNFSLAVEQPIIPQHVDSDASLQSSSSRQSINQVNDRDPSFHEMPGLTIPLPGLSHQRLEELILSIGESDVADSVATDSAVLTLPLSAVQSPASHPDTAQDEVLTPCAPQVSNNHHHQQPQHLDSPDFRDKFLALFYSMTLSSSEDGHSNVAINALGPKEEQLQKIKMYEDMYRVIRDVTGVRDAVKMVARFNSQIETMNYLTELKTAGEAMVADLRKNHKVLESEREDLKYNGESDLVSNQAMVNEYTEKVKEATKEHAALQQELANLSSLMVRCKAGMLHICQKLSDILLPSASEDSTTLPALSPPPETGTQEVANPDESTVAPDDAPELVDSQSTPPAKKLEESTEESSSESDQVDLTLGLIKGCSMKVKLLLSSLSNYDCEEESNKVEISNFFEKAETKVPDFNTRIVFPQDLEDVPIDDDDDMLYDDGGAPSRIALKKQSQQIIEMRTKKRGPGDKSNKGR